jgi:hypothetical protein
LHEGHTSAIVICLASHITHHTSHITHHTSHTTHHTPNTARHTSHITRDHTVLNPSSHSQAHDSLHWHDTPTATHTQPGANADDHW